MVHRPLFGIFYQPRTIDDGGGGGGDGDDDDGDYFYYYYYYYYYYERGSVGVMIPRRNQSTCGNLPHKRQSTDVRIQETAC
jgi:hypothetical protein